jgi:hypothetical protein
MSVYQDLDREWQQIGATPTAATRLAVWAADEPALAGYVTPRELLTDIAVPDRAERAHDVLRCLLRLAADPLAARAFLQAILPALRAAKVWHPVEDHSAERVAATWEAIRVHAGESPPYPARFIVRVAERRLRTEAEARRRWAARLTELQPESVSCVSCEHRSGGCSDPRRHRQPRIEPLELDDARALWDRVALHLIAAYRSGSLTAAQARLLYATSVVGLRAVDAGRVEGMKPRAVYRALGAAKAALLSVTA